MVDRVLWINSTATSLHPPYTLPRATTDGAPVAHSGCDQFGEEGFTRKAQTAERPRSLAI